MAQSIHTCFHAALTWLLNQEGRGAQSRLAVQQNIDRGYLNAIVKGRKTGSDVVRSRIAEHFNLAYEDMLALGRLVLEEEAGSTDWMVFGQEKKRAVKRISDLKSSGKGSRARLIIHERSVKVARILESGKFYQNALASLIDVIHEAVVMSNENMALRIQVREMQLLVAGLENKVALASKRKGEAL